MTEKQNNGIRMDYYCSATTTRVPVATGACTTVRELLEGVFYTIYAEAV
jgi:hypothetical protein